MAATLSVVPSAAVAVIAATAAPGESADASGRTLFAIEEHLQALVDSTELVVAEQEQEFLVELQAASLAAKDKRDRVAGFLAQCEGQAAIARSECARIKRRQMFFEAAIARMEEYVLRVIMQQPQDAKGRYPKLEGHSSCFKVQQNPPSVVVADEAAAPASCKTITVTLPALLWEQVVDSLDMEFAGQVFAAVKRPDATVVKALVKEQVAAAVPDWKKQLEVRPSVYCNDVPGCSIKAGEWRLVRE